MYPEWVPRPEPAIADATGIEADELKDEVNEAEARLAKIKAETAIAQAE